MSWRVVIAKDSEHIKLRLDSIVIFKNENEYLIPLSDISIIILDGQNTTITTRLLAALTEHSISLVISDPSHTPCGIFHAYNRHSRANKVLQTQMALDEQQKGIIWKKIVTYKLANQTDLLLHFNQDGVAIEKLMDYKNSIEDYDKSNREGHAAKIYFHALFGKKFSRSDEDNTINAGLNYGYAILRAYLAKLVVGYGLQPMLGIFHKNEFNQYNLVDDLIEPFRPFVDGWVFLHMKDSEFITFEDRTKLADLLNKRVQYAGKSYTLGKALEMFVIAFINLIEKGDLTIFCNPIVSSFEGCQK